MLTVWLIRAFTVDLVDHLAAAKGGTTAARLAPALKRRLGVGNSTGLGMAPFLVRHPVLLNNWMMAREEALARVRALPSVTTDTRAAFDNALDAAIDNAARWTSAHPLQIAKLDDLRGDLARLKTHIGTWDTTAPTPWNALYLWGTQTLTLEGQEALLALLLEPHGGLIDGLADCMTADENASFAIDGTQSIRAFRATLARTYDWALAQDFTTPDAQSRFWYVSEEKLEPRLGERFDEPGADREQPLGTAKMAQDLNAALAPWDDAQPLAAFLLAHPDHRQMARRVQQAARFPFSEIRDNLLAADMLPIDILRCKLAFFGASHFDPRSDRWVRIALFQGAPYPDDLHA
jgi:hypothetical protein